MLLPLEAWSLAECEHTHDALAQAEIELRRLGQWTLAHKVKLQRWNVQDRIVVLRAAVDANRDRQLSLAPPGTYDPPF